MPAQVRGREPEGKLNRQRLVEQLATRLQQDIFPLPLLTVRIMRWQSSR